MKKYLKLIRVKHYMKNILILLPAVLTQQLFCREAFFESAIGIAIFSMVSSVIYVVNDIRDVESDRQHPTKCTRPLASGEISERAAKCLVFVLVMGVIFIWGGANKRFAFKYILVPLLYFVMNIAYSMKLKEYPLIDVFILMFGYVLRLVYGGILIGTGVSAWMFLTVTAAAFFLGFGKRRNEFLMYGDTGRANLKRYTLGFLDQACLMSMTTTIVFYSLSCADMDTAVAKAGVNLLWSVPVVFIICLRYVMILHNGRSDGDPMEVLLKDKWLALLCVFYFAVLLLLLYGSDLLHLKIVGLSGTDAMFLFQKSTVKSNV